MIEYFAHILCSITSSRVANQEPTTTCFPDQFIQSADTLCLNACEGARHNRLIKHQEHPVAYIERPEPPEEVQPCQALLHSLCVGGYHSTLLARFTPRYL